MEESNVPPSPADSPSQPPAGSFKRWLLKGHIKEIEGPHEQEGEHPQHPWWQVMCLTGVDYFSTLGYQPGIAALAAGGLSQAGSLAPVGTLILVLLTLFGALPMYHRVAAESPHGDGSISMLENLLAFWQGKLFVLCLIGFAATSFIITITLSAADATAHIVENPLAPSWMQHRVGTTLFLIALLGVVFLKGFGEAIGIAVGIVAAYIVLNLIVLGRGFYEIVLHPDVLATWKNNLFISYPNPFLMIGAGLLLFPKLALGLSGFETGVVVMPLVRGDAGDTPENPVGRIRNARKLLTAAALIMSVLLMCSSIVTTTLIPYHEFEEHGKANGRALAYLAHKYLGEGFGTVYDLSTIAILWFAGASALAGLLNIVPRYLPRYGMAPDWTRATRPLVIIFTLISFVVTILFRADVEDQGGAYATGVLTLMTSAAIAVTLSVWRDGARKKAFKFGIVTVIFIYTTAVNIHAHPDGLRIAGIFIGGIILTSLISRVWRTTELRVQRIELDETAQKFIEEVSQREIHIVANKVQAGDMREYVLKEDEARVDNHIPASFPILFFEVHVGDASEFEDVLEVRGVEVDGYKVLRAEYAAVPNAIAAFLMYLRDTTGKRPHAYFAWAEGNPLIFVFRYVLLGEGDTAPVTREILRQVEHDPQRRPAIHVGGR